MTRLSPEPPIQSEPNPYGWRPFDQMPSEYRDGRRLWLRHPDQQHPGSFREHVGRFERGAWYVTPGGMLLLPDKRWSWRVHDMPEIDKRRAIDLWNVYWNLDAIAADFGCQRRDLGWLSQAVQDHALRHGGRGKQAVPPLDAEAILHPTQATGRRRAQCRNPSAGA